MYTGMMYTLDYIYETDISVIYDFRLQKLTRAMFTKLYHWYARNKSLKSIKKKFFYKWKNMPAPPKIICIQTGIMWINRVISVQYLGMLLDEILHKHDHVDQICA